MKNIKKVLIVDTKAGNLFSLDAALKRLGFEVSILPKPPTEDFDAVVIPGQGRFGTVLSNLREANWPAYFENCRQQQKPMFGICVGMQIFFESSEEDSGVKGLGWFKGGAEALQFPKKPMVGWADLDTIGRASTWPEEPVYFVNSFAVRSSEYAIAKTEYGENFCAAVAKDNFVGVQFHPEKSAECGAEIIRQSLTNGEAQ